MEGSTYMYHVECIDIQKTDAMYLYIDRACLCANNMYNVANFHIRNLMTGLKKDISLRTENEKSVIRTFASSIPAVNFSLRVSALSRSSGSSWTGAFLQPHAKLSFRG